MVHHPPVIDQELESEEVVENESCACWVVIMAFTFFFISVIYVFAFIILACYNESTNTKKTFDEIG